MLRVKQLIRKGEDVARVISILVFVACIFMGYGCDGSSGRAPKKRTPSAKPKLFMSKEERELQRKREIIGQKKEALNNTEWDIDMIGTSAETGESVTIKDTVVFVDNKVLSKRLESQGFLPTNYTLSLKDDEKVIWETMQTGENQLVFFRGEISQDLTSMAGVISFQKPGGSEDYSFQSTDKRKIFLSE
jgi:hypothetical protein